MSLIGSEILAGASGQAGAAGYQIEQSLRFANGGNYLTRTPSSAGSRTTWTYSAWVKYTIKSANHAVLLSAGSAGSNYDNIRITTTGHTPNNALSWYSNNANYSITAAKVRDPSAWYHFVFVWDTTNGTAADRRRMYINGVRQTDFYSNSNPGSSTQSYVNNNWLHAIGALTYNVNTTSEAMDGYMAEVHFVDGTAKNPTDFGEYDESGVWRPIAYSGSYGSNGYYLKFDPSAANGIGHDHSGNGNNFTPSGFTTSGDYTDVMDDTPTTNWATLNPLTGFRPNGATGRTYSDGNLVEYTPNSSGKEHPLITTTQFVRSADGGVYQFEDTVTNSNAWITFNPWLETENAYGSGNAAFFDFYNYSGYGTVSVGTGYGATGTVQEQGVALSASDVVTTVVDFDNNTIAFYVNGTRNGYITGCNFSNWDIWSPGFAIATGGATATTHTTNFGQQAFQYTPVSGAKPWSTAELPAPDISDPSEYFQTVLDTGANILSSAQSTFTNGLWWIKDRANSNQHQLVDSVRGGSLALTTPNYVAESSYSAPTGNSVAWCWNVSSPTTSGFEILTWSGNSSAGRTISHTLGITPEFIITKNRDDFRSFAVYHKSLAAGDILWLDDTAGSTTRDIYRSVGASSIALSDDIHCNATGYDYVSYLWRSVPGYSRIGAYAGNGNADGPFVYCGFRPAFVMLKRTSGTNDWIIQDAARNPYNVVDNILRPSYAQGDTINSIYSIDIVSNGFKVRNSTAAWNALSSTYIFMAFAENPFGGSGVTPATAR